MIAEAQGQAAVESSQGRIARNAVIYLIGQTLSWSVALLTVSVIPRTLGKEALGDLALAQTPIAMIASTLALAFEPYLYTEIGRDRTQTTRLVAATYGLRLLLIAPMLLGTLVWMYVTHASAHVWLLTYPLLLVAVLGFFSEPLRSVLIGWEEAKRVSLMDILFSLGPLFALPFLARGPIVLVYASLIPATIVFLTRLYWVAPRISLRPHFEPALWWTIIRAAFVFYITGVVMQLYGMVAIYMLKYYAGPGAVGVFSQSQRLQGTFLFLATAPGMALLPVLMRMAEADEARFQRVQRRILALVITLSLPVTTLILLLAEPFCHLLYTKSEFQEMPRVLQVVGVNLIPIYITTVMYQFLVAKRKNGIWAFFLLGTVGVNAAGCALFIPLTMHLYGNAPMGAALSVLVAETLTAICAFILLKNNPLNGETLQRILRSLLASIGMGVVVWLTRKQMLLIPAALGIVTFALLGWYLRVLGEEERHLLTEMIRRRLPRRRP